MGLGSRLDSLRENKPRLDMATNESQQHHNCIDQLQQSFLNAAMPVLTGRREEQPKKTIGVLLVLPVANQHNLTPISFSSASITTQKATHDGAVENMPTVK